MQDREAGIERQPPGDLDARPCRRSGCCPRSRTAAGRPRPRNDRPDSVRMAAGMPRVMATRTGRDGVGQDVAQDDPQRRWPRPPRDQMTNSRSRRVRNSARTSRATPIQPVRPITAMMVQIEGLQERQHRQQQEEAGEDQHQVDQPHDDGVDHAAVVAGGGAQQDADGRRDADRHEARPPATPGRRTACGRARRGRADRCRSQWRVEGGFRIFFVSGRFGSQGAISGASDREQRPGTPPPRRRPRRAGCGGSVRQNWRISPRLARRPRSAPRRPPTRMRGSTRL